MSSRNLSNPMKLLYFQIMFVILVAFEGLVIHMICAWHLQAIGLPFISWPTAIAIRLLYSVFTNRFKVELGPDYRGKSHEDFAAIVHLTKPLTALLIAYALRFVL